MAGLSYMVSHLTCLFQSVIKWTFSCVVTHLSLYPKMKKYSHGNDINQLVEYMETFHEKYLLSGKRIIGMTSHILSLFVLALVLATLGVSEHKCFKSAV